MSNRLHNPSALPAPNGYSHVAEVAAGSRILYTAGQVTRSSSPEFAIQLEEVFENLRLALEASGASFHDVIKLNYYCVDKVSSAELPRVREVRDRYVNVAQPPASTFVFVSRLVRPEWLIEIEAVAAVSR